MAHLMAHKAGGAVGVLRHDERTQHDKVESRKNECIIPERTHLNYNLAPERTLPLSKHIEKVCEDNDVRLNKRKDLNVMVSWVVTAPKTLPDNEQEVFFKSAYKFLSNRYGKEFVLSASVHLDETTPHLHFNFIPVGIDKNGNKTVSSKLVCTRAELQSFHKDLSKHLEKELGHPVDVLNEATAEGNKAITELKRESAIKEINDLKLKKQALQGQIKVLKNINATLSQIQSLKAEKGVLGQIKGITLEDFEKLKELAIKGFLDEDKIERLNAKIKSLEIKNQHLSNKIMSPMQELELIQKLQKLDDMEKLLKNIPSDVIYQYQNKNKSSLKNQKHER